MKDEVIKHLLSEFKKVEEKRDLKNRSRRIGSELKFPLVKADGKVIEKEKVDALWDFLESKGWDKNVDSVTKRVVGATKDGHMNEHLASCETGFCKIEFSLAHTDNLFELNKDIGIVTELMREFSQKHDVAFLGFGLQPINPPGKKLTMKKGRNMFWDRLFGGNKHIDSDKGTDVHLFTISASNQTHIDVTMDEAVKAINVFNGLAGAQVGLTANSNIWKGEIDEGFKCLGEAFWDWWLKDRYEERYGVPEKKFESIEDYFSHILGFKPVYVKREGLPIGLPDCPCFLDFYSCNPDNPSCEKWDENKGCCGMKPDGERVQVSGGQSKDIDQHFTFFWHNARLSRHYTLENRINDQQPPGEWIVIPALTLGLMENLEEAWQFVNSYDWELLQRVRTKALEEGINAEVDNIKVKDLSKKMVDIAEKGLKKRGQGEEKFLQPLHERLSTGECPADKAAEVFQDHGIKKFVKKFKVK